MTPSVTRPWYPGDVDPVAVERWFAGHKIGRELFPNEEVEIARRLRANGATKNMIMVRLHIGAKRATELWAATDEGTSVQARPGGSGS